MQQPSVGRIVHYVMPSPSVHGGVCCAALVIAASDNDDIMSDELTNVTLKATDPAGNDHIVVNPPKDGGAEPDGKFGHWHWPERA